MNAYQADVHIIFSSLLSLGTFSLSDSNPNLIASPHQNQAEPTYSKPSTSGYHISINNTNKTGLMLQMTAARRRSMSKDEKTFLN
jgi:hypothetical protein